MFPVLKSLQPLHAGYEVIIKDNMIEPASFLSQKTYRNYL